MPAFVPLAKPPPLPATTASKRHPVLCVVYTCAINPRAPRMHRRRQGTSLLLCSPVRLEVALGTFFTELERGSSLSSAPAAQRGGRVASASLASFDDDDFQVGEGFKRSRTQRDSAAVRKPAGARDPSASAAGWRIHRSVQSSIEGVEKAVFNRWYPRGVVLVQGIRRAPDEEDGPSAAAAAAANDLDPHVVSALDKKSRGVAAECKRTKTGASSPGGAVQDNGSRETSLSSLSGSRAGILPAQKSAVIHRVLF